MEVYPHPHPVALASLSRAGGRMGPQEAWEAELLLCICKEAPCPEGRSGQGLVGVGAQRSSAPPLPQKSPPWLSCLSSHSAWRGTGCLTLKPDLPKKVMLLCFQEPNLRSQGKKEGEGAGQGRKERKIVGVGSYCSPGQQNHSKTT